MIEVAFLSVCLLAMVTVVVNAFGSIVFYAFTHLFLSSHQSIYLLCIINLKTFINKKYEDRQCKFTHKVKIHHPVRSDGWMDSQKKVKIAIGDLHLFGPELSEGSLPQTSGRGPGPSFKYIS